MSEIKYAMSIIRGKLKNADEHNLHYQRFSIADMEAILGVLSKSESDYAALQQKLDPMAAENALMLADYRDIPEMRRIGAPQTPATDAYLNSVRAEGADKVAEYHFVRIDVLKEVSRQGYLFHKAAYADAVSVANQLRSGTHDTADKAG